jgi:hypothetical protein
MYRIKIQRFDAQAGGSDVAQPFLIETLEETCDAALAMALVKTCVQDETIGVVWIEPAVWIN